MRRILRLRDVGCKRSTFAEGDTILLDAREGELVFEKAGAVEPASSAVG